MKEAAVVIPAYNEGKFIKALIKKVKSLYDIYVLVVDDGSSDNTFDEASSAADKVFKHTVNSGKGRSIVDGVRIAGESFKYALLMDGDFQHAPEDVGRFLKKCTDGYDIVIGRRDMSVRNMPLLRYLTNRTTTLVVSILAGRKVYDSQSGFRMVKAESISGMTFTTSRFQTESEMLIKAGRKGMKIGYVTVKTIYGDEVSKINPIKDTARFIKMALEVLWL